MKFLITKDQLNQLNESSESQTRYMFFSNLEQMIHQAKILLELDKDKIESLLNNGHDWAADHITEAKNNIDQVFDFIMGEVKKIDYEDVNEGDMDYDNWHEEDIDQLLEYVNKGVFELEDKCLMNEAEYQGRKVTLNKPMAGDVKKFKVYVKNPTTGNIVKINFGQKGVKIKKNNPARRKSFRARHGCDKGKLSKLSAKYWSCKKW